VKLLPFIGVAFIAVVVPGPDMLLVTRNAFIKGTKAGVVSALGIVSGLTVHATAAAFGLSAVLLSSARAFMVLKALGALYLLFLGIRALWAAIRGNDVAIIEGSSRQTNKESFLTPLRQGFFTNVLNPKAALFILALLPQFMDRHGPVVLQTYVLVAVLAVIAFMWFSFCAVLVSHGRGVFQRSGFRRALDGMAGLVFVTFGIRLAFERAR